MHIVIGVNGQLRAGPGMPFESVGLRHVPPARWWAQPKVNLLEIIYELEPWDGSYNGRHRWFFLPRGDMDQAITIRRSSFRVRWLQLSAGGGIRCRQFTEN